MGGFTCPRDLFFVAGKQVIEAACRNSRAGPVKLWSFQPGTNELAQSLLRARGVEGLVDEPRPQLNLLRSRGFCICVLFSEVGMGYCRNLK